MRCCWLILCGIMVRMSVHFGELSLGKEWVLMPVHSLRTGFLSLLNARYSTCVIHRARICTFSSSKATMYTSVITVSARTVWNKLILSYLMDGRRAARKERGWERYRLCLRPRIGPIRLVGMSELQPIIPARDESNPGGLVVATPHDPIEAPPITEQEVGEYREQDRFLPVRLFSLLPVCLWALTPSLSSGWSSGQFRNRLPMFLAS